MVAKALTVQYKNVYNLQQNVARNSKPRLH